MLEPMDQNRQDYTHIFALLLIIPPGLVLAGELADRLSWRENVLELLVMLAASAFSIHLSTWLKARAARRSGQPMADKPKDEPERRFGGPQGLTSLPLILGYVFALILAGLAAIGLTELLLRDERFRDLLPFIPTILLAFLLTNFAFNRLRRRTEATSVD